MFVLDKPTYFAFHYRDAFGMQSELYLSPFDLDRSPSPESQIIEPEASYFSSVPLPDIDSPWLLSLWSPHSECVEALQDLYIPDAATAPRLAGRLFRYLAHSSLQVAELHLPS